MSEIVIKKRVSLEFLGAEYKDSYLEFKAVRIADYDSLFKRLDKAKTRLDNIKTIVDILKEQFIGGEFSGKEVTKEELDSFDEDTLAECFGRITGQKTDPK